MNAELPADIKNAVNDLPIPAAVYDFENYKVVTAAISKGFLDLFGFRDREEAINLMDHNMYRDTHPDDIARVADIAYRFATEGGRFEAVYRSRINTDDTMYHIIHSTGCHFKTEDGHRYALVWYIDETGALRDDHSKSAQELLKALDENVDVQTRNRRNNYDDLTGLPNMGYFLQLAGAARSLMKEEKKTPVLLFFDLNGLKYYNHQFGLAQGDQLIRTLSEQIRLRFGSENAGRFGADHFVVLSESDQIEKKLKELFAVMEKACNGESLPLRVGIYSDAFGEVGISTACDRAKIACDSDRNIYHSRYVWFDQNMLEQADEKEYLLSHLNEALEKRWIMDYYQPIIRAENGKVCDEEALARWNDPERGMMRPDQFIPVLEDAGLLYKLDLYMVDRVIDFIRKKKESGISVVPVSVNLSERDFMACNMVNEIDDRLRKAGLTPDYLTIEITERAIGRNPELLSSVIDDFHARGYKIWLDDFGSEYSSLNVLQDYKFELIKLDMKFLRKFNTNDMSRLIINEVLDLARKAKVETVTEGVETTEQVAFLSEAGCIKLQGFLYSRPVPADEILKEYQKGDKLVLEDTDL